MTGVKGQNSVKSIPTALEEQEDETVKVCLEDFSFLQVLGKGSFGKVDTLVSHMQLFLITKFIYLHLIIINSHYVLKE